MKKRVAFCMYGAIPKESHASFLKGEIYKEGKYINYKQAYNSMIKHIIEPNSNYYNFDFFQHCWAKDLETDVISLYKPKSFNFENNSIYYDEIDKLCKKPTDFSGISKALSIKKSIELKEKYEKENDVTYDIVIMYRYDALIWKDIILNEYTNISNAIYSDAHYTPTGETGEFYFIMDNTYSNQFKYLYDNVSNNPVNPHFWIKTYINNYIKLPLLRDSIIPGIHLCNLVKINACSINPGHLSLKVFNSFL